MKIFNVDIEKLSDKVGIVGSKKWSLKFSNKHLYRSHINFLTKMYNIKELDSWIFIGGTIFLANSKIIKYIAHTNFQQVYNKLNNLNSIDDNWLRMAKIFKKNTNGCSNDFKYRTLHPKRKSLMSDYMIEHTYERIISLISINLSLTILSI